MVHRPLLQRWTIFLDGDCFPGSWVRTTLEPEQRTPITVVHVKRFQERDKSKVCWDWRLLILQDRDDHQRLIWCFSFYFLGQCFLFFLENFSVWSFFRPQRPQVFLIKALQKLMVFVLESREGRKYYIQDSKSVLKQQKERLKAKAVSQRGFLHAVSAVQCEKNNMKQPRRKSVGKSCVTDNFFVASLSSLVLVFLCFGGDTSLSSYFCARVSSMLDEDGQPLCDSSWKNMKSLWSWNTQSYASLTNGFAKMISKASKEQTVCV